MKGYGMRKNEYGRFNKPVEEIKPKPNQTALSETQVPEPLDENLIVFGRNPVREALRSGRSIERIWVEKDLADGSIRELVNLARDQKRIVVEASRQKLDELCLPFGYGGRPGHHQGIAARLPGVEYVAIQTILEAAKEKGEPPLLLILDSITDPENLGSILRSAECFGAHGVVLPERRSAGVTPAAIRASAGAALHVPVARVTNISATIQELKKAGLWIICADQEGQSARKVDFKGPVAIVIGAEGKGVSKLIKSHCDFTAAIEMRGKTGSLNAAVAAALMLYEKQRQEGEA